MQLYSHKSHYNVIILLCYGNERKKSDYYNLVCLDLHEALSNIINFLFDK